MSAASLTGVTAAYAGKTVLARIECRDERDELVDRVFIVGVIVAIDDQGIHLCGDDGKYFWLPPAIEYLETPDQDVYRLSCSRVVEPDFTAQWIVYPPSLDEVSAIATAV